MSESQRTALVTGASSGIGLELARLCARDRYQVVLTARSEGRMADLAAELCQAHGVKVTVLPADLARSGAPEEIAAALREASLTVDVLVNNAGFGVQGPFAATRLETELAMLQVNVLALTQLTKLVLPGMVARGAGRILNVASAAAFQPGPLMAVYYASKAYVLSFSEALAEELRGTGVTVTALCPGPTHTAFRQRAGMEQVRLFRFGVMDAPSVARAGYQAMMAGRAVVVPGLKNALLAFSVRLAPRSVVRKIVRALNDQPRG